MRGGSTALREMLLETSASMEIFPAEVFAPLSSSTV